MKKTIATEIMRNDRESYEKYGWALQDDISGEQLTQIVAILGQLPARWGRMVPMARLLLVEVGRLLQDKNIIVPGQKCSDLALNVGFIGGTRRGCLHTDQAFIDTMAAGPGLASPALFGYTLPNIPLAEAASHYGLVGPVYAIIESDNPLGAAQREAEQLLNVQNDLSLMVACEFDHYTVDTPGNEESPEQTEKNEQVQKSQKIHVTLTLVEKDGDSNPDLPQVE